MRNLAMAMRGMKVFVHLAGLHLRKRRNWIIFSSWSFGYFIYGVLNIDVLRVINDN